MCPWILWFFKAHALTPWLRRPIQRYMPKKKKKAKFLDSPFVTLRVLPVSGSDPGYATVLLRWACAELSGMPETTSWRLYKEC